MYSQRYKDPRDVSFFLFVFLPFFFGATYCPTDGVFLELYHTFLIELIGQEGGARDGISLP